MEAWCRKRSKFVITDQRYAWWKHTDCVSKPAKRGFDVSRMISRNRLDMGTWELIATYSKETSSKLAGAWSLWSCVLDDLRCGCGCGHSVGRWLQTLQNSSENLNPPTSPTFKLPVESQFFTYGFCLYWWLLCIILLPTITGRHFLKSIKIMCDRSIKSLRIRSGNYQYAT